MACHHIPPLVDPLQLLQVFIEYVQRLERLHDLPNGVSPPGGIMLQVPKKGGRRTNCGQCIFLRQLADWKRSAIT